MSLTIEENTPACTVCQHFACICVINQEHAKDCKFRKAATCGTPIECDHGYDVCPTCDPCTCGTKITGKQLTGNKQYPEGTACYKYDINLVQYFNEIIVDDNNLINSSSEEFIKTMADIWIDVVSKSIDSEILGVNTCSTASTYTNNSLTVDKILDTIPKSFPINNNLNNLFTPNPFVMHSIPDVVEIKLSWKERLLSWPWKPWVKTKFIDNPTAPKKGEAWIINPAYLYALSNPVSNNEVVVVRESDYNHVKNKLLEH